MEHLDEKKGKNECECNMNNFDDMYCLLLRYLQFLKLFTSVYLHYGETILMLSRPFR